MSIKNCGNCKFALDVTPGETDEIKQRLACRRYPPTLMYQPVPEQKVLGSEPSISWKFQGSAYPQMRPIAWCGEHQDAPAAIFNS